MDTSGEEKAGVLEEKTQLWGEKVLEPGTIEDNQSLPLLFSGTIIVQQSLPL